MHFKAHYYGRYGGDQMLQVHSHAHDGIAFLLPPYIYGRTISCSRVLVLAYQTKWGSYCRELLGCQCQFFIGMT